MTNQIPSPDKCYLCDEMLADATTIDTTLRSISLQLSYLPLYSQSPSYECPNKHFSYTQDIFDTVFHISLEDAHITLRYPIKIIARYPMTVCEINDDAITLPFYLDFLSIPPNKLKETIEFHYLFQ
jgi:hypothetical protein